VLALYHYTLHHGYALELAASFLGVRQTATPPEAASVTSGLQKRDQTLLCSFVYWLTVAENILYEIQMVCIFLGYKPLGS